MDENMSPKKMLERLLDMGLIRFDYVEGEAAKTVKCIKTGKVIAEIHLTKKALVIKDEGRWDELTFYSP